MRPVVLSGFMATGKSTVGPQLAAKLAVPFVDTDAEIEKAAGKTVPDLWREEGEASFRAREGALVERLLSDRAPKVVAFGGGTVTVDRARRFAIDHALVVTLTATAEAICARAPDLARRPNLAVGGDPLDRARELLAARAAAYAECHLSLSNEVHDTSAVVETIASVLKRDPILVPLGLRSYAVDVCAGVPLRLTDAISRLAPSSVVLLTDSNVWRARGAWLDEALRPLSFAMTQVTLPPGEAHKTLGSVAAVWDAALAAGVDRDALIVAAGGGVVGDLGGFAAACLLRGIRVMQVPTTLLAMVDASIGGKTGFDHPAGKNLIGAFHQPSAVVADLAHLGTLPARERTAGLAEVVKIGLTSDALLFERIEHDAARLARGEPEALLPVVRAAIEAKVRIVRDDEREGANRALLNLGHTIGHALEAHGGYVRWLHGEAVSLGIVAEMAGTAAMGLTPPALADRARMLLKELGLPVAPSPGEIAACWPYVSTDKKRAGGSLRLPIVTALGSAYVGRIVAGELQVATCAGGAG